MRKALAKHPMTTDNTLLRLHGVDGIGSTTPFTFQTLGGGELLLASNEGNLRCGQAGRVDFAGQKGKWARWLVVEAEGTDNYHYFENVGHRDQGTPKFLASAQGHLVAADAPAALRIVSVATSEAVSPPLWRLKVSTGPPAPPEYRLTPEQIAGFTQTGYLILPKLVSEELVADALRNINMGLGHGAAFRRQPDGIKASAQLRQHPSILGLLYSSPLFGVVEQLIGEGKAKKPKMAQVALRFPNNRNTPDDDVWHIDSMKSWHKSSFQLLVGVALSQQPTDNCGQLTVWPGRHTTLHEAAKEVRTLRPPPKADNAPSVDDAGEPLEEEEKEADIFGAEDPWMGRKPSLLAHEAVQTRMEPGTVVIAHQKMPHRIAPNRSPHIRYQVRNSRARTHACRSCEEWAARSHHRRIDPLQRQRDGPIDCP